MSKDFLPRREADLVTWSTNFDALIVAGPLAYGISAVQASGYNALHNAFVTSYNIANSDLTRTPASIITKNASLNLLIANARLLAGVVQKFPATTNTQRAALGLSIRGTPTPIGPPTVEPTIDIIHRVATTVTIRLHDGSASRRRKPRGVQGASLFSHVGPTAPADVKDWDFHGNSTRSELDVQFSSTLPPGTLVWFTARWYSPRGESGPGCTPISATLAGGGIVSKAA